MTPDTPQKPTLRKVRNMHVAIADYMIANPEASQRKIAGEFGVSESWLSIIINSDAFKEHLHAKNQEVFDTHVVPLRTKLLGVANLAVEKLGEKVSTAVDPDFILAAADKTLHRLGYAPSKGPDPAAPPQVNQQNNFYMVDKDLLAGARERIVGRGEVQPVEQEAKPLLPE